MTLSPFMKEHKGNLKNLSKKQLINQVLTGIELAAHRDIEKDEEIEELNKRIDRISWFLECAEDASLYKDKVIERYKSLLEISVTDL